MNNTILVTLIIFSIILILGFMFFFERKNISLNLISLIVVLSTLGALSRISFSFIPSVVGPTTVIVMISGIILGVLPGIAVGILVPIISNMYLGMGIWTLWQIIGWGLCGFISAMIAKIIGKDKIIIFTIFSFLFGFLFGWVTNLWGWIMYSHELNFKTWVASIAMSFVFDMIHSLTNLFFFLVLGKLFMNILERYKNKLNISNK